jgi:hypothetical protein
MGPDEKMKPDVELALTDETVDERREVYLYGEKKFVNYLDCYGDYQYKNVRKELQKLHAFILRDEFVDKIKSREEVRFIEDMSKTYFRILSYQIDRESWFKVPVGIDPEPDARILYESATGPRNDAQRQIVFEPENIRNYFDVIAAGIDNYYFTNQVEIAAWIVRYYDEAILRYVDKRTEGSTGGNTWRVWLSFKYPKDHRKAGEPIYVDITNPDTLVDNNYGTASVEIIDSKIKYDFVADESFFSWIWSSGSRNKFRQAIQRGLERDIIVPYRRIRGQEFRYRDVVVIEDGSPILVEDPPGSGKYKHILRSNAEDKDNVSKVWFARDDAGNFTADPGMDVIIGSNKVLGSPSAVLANPELYDREGTAETLEEYVRAEFKNKNTGLFYKEGAYGIWLQKTDIRQEDWDRQLDEVQLSLRYKNFNGNSLSLKDALRAEVLDLDGNNVTTVSGVYNFNDETWTIHVQGERGYKVNVYNKDDELIDTRTLSD